MRPDSALKASTAAIAALLAAATLSGCADARRALGYEKAPPDEFAVIARAPLSQPPDYLLRPPTPGAPRPQEGTTVDQARAALIPGKTLTSTPAAGSKGEQAILVKSGGDKADPAIRAKVDEETLAIVEANSSFVEKLMFWKTDAPPGEAVDAAGERQRLKDNAAQGKPATAGETVKIERKSSGFLDRIF